MIRQAFNDDPLPVRIASNNGEEGSIQRRERDFEPANGAPYELREVNRSVSFDHHH